MLTSQQAEWLVTFYRNLPGQQPPEQQPVRELLQPESQEPYAYEDGRGYPYFDLREMNVRR